MPLIKQIVHYCVVLAVYLFESVVHNKHNSNKAPGTLYIYTQYRKINISIYINYVSVCVQRIYVPCHDRFNYIVIDSYTIYAYIQDLLRRRRPALINSRIVSILLYIEKLLRCVPLDQREESLSEQINSDCHHITDYKPPHAVRAAAPSLEAQKRPVLHNTLHTA